MLYCIERKRAGLYPLPVPSFGENLKREREARGLTQDEVAKRMGYTNNSQVAAWERSPNRLPDPENVRKAAEAIGCEPRLLLLGVETDYDRLRRGADDVDADVIDVSGFKKDDIPVVAEGDASPQPNLFWDNSGVLLSEVEDRVTRPREISDPRAYGVRVRGDSMITRLQPGDVAIISPNTPAQDGDEVYAQLLSGERLLKVAHKITGGWLLESYNRAYPPRQVKRSEIGAMHPILWIRSKRRGRRVVPEKDHR